ncbi:hypothetical protein FN846DRAFT_554222 [Sphaerosporella brunnea]|uniref:Uncharacterized protein n=1 Tax=Sphaerosporella brunnea TaxID=1250544 RepID=A0A5J5F293_9PEZI|nr:hypothetical protein FN846DRAFT_554222 [Sphaerosporella brunnea]
MCKQELAVVAIGGQATAQGSMRFVLSRGRKKKIKKKSPFPVRWIQDRLAGLLLDGCVPPQNPCCPALDHLVHIGYRGERLISLCSGFCGGMGRIFDQRWLPRVCVDGIVGSEVKQQPAETRNWGGGGCVRGGKGKPVKERKEWHRKPRKAQSILWIYREKATKQTTVEKTCWKEGTVVFFARYIFSREGMPLMTPGSVMLFWP